LQLTVVVTVASDCGMQYRGSWGCSCNTQRSYFGQNWLVLGKFD